MKKKIWYLPGPFYRYDADVKAEAARAGVRIVDAHVATRYPDAAPLADLPRVEFKPGYKPTADDIRVMRAAYQDQAPATPEADNEEMAAALAAAEALAAPTKPGKK